MSLYSPAAALIAVLLYVCAATVGSAQCDSCEGDLDKSGAVTIDELVTVVGNALEGCEGSSESESDIAIAESVD